MAHYSIKEDSDVPAGFVLEQSEEDDNGVPAGFVLEQSEEVISPSFQLEEDIPPGFQLEEPVSNISDKVPSDLISLENLPQAKLFEPSIWDKILSLGNTDANRAKSMNEWAAQEIAVRENISVEEVYTSAGFLRPIVNPEGRPSAQALFEGSSIIAAQLPDVGKNIVNSVLRVIRGADETAEDNFLDDAIKHTEPAKIEDIDPNYKDLYGLGKSLGVSLTVLAASALAGTAASGTVVGAVPAAMATGGTVAYRISKDEFIDRVKTRLDEEYEKLHGRKMNQEEWSKAYDEYEMAAIKYGAWEAIPEALSNVVIMRLLATPLKGMGKKGLEEFAKRAAQTMVAEQTTETITGTGQSYSEVEAGFIKKPKTPGEAFREQVVPTSIITALLGGGGAGARYTYEALQPKIKVFGKEFLEQVEGTEFVGAREKAVQVLSPDNAKYELEKTKVTIAATETVDDAIDTAEEIINEELGIKKEDEKNGAIISKDRGIQKEVQILEETKLRATKKIREDKETSAKETVIAEDEVIAETKAEAALAETVKPEPVTEAPLISTEKEEFLSKEVNVKSRYDSYLTTLDKGKTPTDKGFNLFMKDMRGAFDEQAKVAPEGAITDETDLTQFIQAQVGQKIPLSDIRLTREITGKDGKIKVAQGRADVVLRQTRKKRAIAIKLLGCVNG